MKNIESFSSSLNDNNCSSFKFFAIGPLKLFFIKEINPKPAAPSSLAQLFNLSKKLLGWSPVSLTIIPLTT